MQKIKPPGIAEFILSLFMRSEVEKNRLGDFEEIYQNIKEDEGTLEAWKWYWGQALLSIPGLIYNQIYWSVTMFKNYLTVAIRNIASKKAFTTINLLGLTISLTAVLLIALYIKYELNYEGFYKNSENIYRLVGQSKDGHMGLNKYVWTAGIVAPAIKENIPGIIAATTIGKGNCISLKYGTNSHAEEDFYFANQDFFKVFSGLLSDENSENKLSRPFTIYISRKMANKYFGNENPVGKLLKYNNNYDFTVAGIFADVPANTHFKYDFIASFVSLETILSRYNMLVWNDSSYWTYLLLNSNHSSAEVGNKISKFINENDPYQNKYYLEKLSDIHFSGKINGDFEENSQIKDVYILISIAFLILISGLVNYINLSTANAAKRINEIGIRKIIGANKKQLFTQLIGESLLLTIFSFILAFIIALVLLPYFSQLTNRELNIDQLLNLKTLSMSIISIIVLGIIAGLYPSLYLLSFEPSKIIRKEINIKTSKLFSFRNIMVVSQFIITIFLTTASMIIYRQYHYIKNKDLGHDKNNIIIIKGNNTGSPNNAELAAKMEIIKNEIKNIPGVINIAASYWLPTEIRTGTEANWQGEKGEERTRFYILRADSNLIDTYGMKMLEGRKFTKEDNGNSENVCIINETGLKLTQLKNPIGKQIAFSNGRGQPRTIIGIIKDFHSNSMHQTINPVVILPGQSVNYISIKVRTENINETVARIGDKWKELSGMPFDYKYLNEIFDSMYESEYILGKVINHFTLLAVIITMLGALGLVSLTTKRRIKEIGIRKALGAMTNSILWLIIYSFIKHILVAAVITIPVVYYMMAGWLNDFAYKINLGIGIFVITLLFVVAITLVTIWFVAYKAAIANPVDSLRNE